MNSENALRKSTSIPVHLTVTAAESRELPYSLRPDQFADGEDGALLDEIHDSDCEIVKARRICPRAASPSIQRNWTSSPQPQKGAKLPQLKDRATVVFPRRVSTTPPLSDR